MLQIKRIAPSEGGILIDLLDPLDPQDPIDPCMLLQ
jgi:hypothetical protein